MPVLPKPYPDEVVGSVIVRACRHTGLPLKRLLRTIYDSQRSTASFLLGENLAPLAHRAGLELDALLIGHTMFPYAIAFMAPAIQRQLTVKAMATHPREDSLASLTKSISHGVPYRRVCKQCIRSDLAVYGESYWHRQHLLPGVSICPQHGRPLFETEVELRGRAHTRVALLPHEADELKPVISLPLKIASRVAAVSVAALRGEIPSSENRLHSYRVKAAELGYLLPSGDIAGSVVTHMVRKSFGPKYLAWMGCPIDDGPRSTWPALMVRPGGAPNFAAPKHVLMHAFLEAGLPPPDMSSIYRAPGKKTRDYSLLDTHTLAKVRARVKLSADVGERITIEKLLRDAGVWSAFNHRRELFPKTDAFIQAFRYSDQSERQLGRRLCWRKRFPCRNGADIPLADMFEQPPE